jgi:glycosyltransferase involved in cell wall biosynthesis
LASTTNKYAGLMVRFKTMSQERWERNFFKTPKSLGSANNGICTAELSAIFAGMARIALNARLLIPGRLEGIGWFTDACYRRIIAAHPEHEFLLLFDRKPDSTFEYGTNATSMRLFPPARRPFLYDAWFDYSVTHALRKWKADVFVSTDGMLSRRTTVPQLAVFHDLNYMHRPEWMPDQEARYYRSRFPEFARIAQRVVTVSEFSKADIVEQFGVPPDAIDVVYNAPDSIYSQGAATARDAEKRFTAGRPYFLFVGSLHPRKNLGGLLKAYEFYRARGGEYELLIVGAGMWTASETNHDGVHYAGRLGREELAEVMREAEGLVFVPWFEGFGVPIVEAFASGVPVIASNTTAMPEVCGGAAAALVNPANANEIAEAMTLLETDGSLRNRAIQAGLARASEFSWDDSAQRLMASIEKVIGAHA